MPQPSWNEIQDRAAVFANRWAGETYEKGESQTFWSEFLTVFGIDRRRHGAFFEYAIKKTGGKQGFIDLFWPGRLLAEQKSAGRDLDVARIQAFDYLPAMPDHDLPEAIVACDFATFQIYNLTIDRLDTFTLDQFPRRTHLFAFLIGETNRYLAEEDPVNRQAAEGMAQLHNQLAANRYIGRDLELLLVRLVFCLFADDAQIFEHGSFGRFLRNRTRGDGTDLGPLLGKIFEVLNTPTAQRQTTLDDDLQAFPYINGGLFEDTIRLPDFNTAMRNSLLSATLVDWSKVSPAIFGSMFQGVMDDVQRRNLGAHYTSEKNILRVIQPLFLDDLYAEFERVRHSTRLLERFHTKLSTLNFLDPACGCGNFLVITYRELRRLEHKVVKDLLKGQQILDVTSLLRVNVNQLHGIEIEEFPSRIAQTALWLTDHQMNLEASQAFGMHYVRLPLTASANIQHDNALTRDWTDVVDFAQLSYVLGNPPFIGKKEQSKAQKALLSSVFPPTPGVGNLDFVAAWYIKAARLISGTNIRCAFVSTNSITQGEQPGVLWPPLWKLGMQILFAHRTFEWSNQARGEAAVHCVIIGFSSSDPKEPIIYEYDHVRGEPIRVPARTINQYLVDAENVLITRRAHPINEVPEMDFGSKAADFGFLTLSSSERSLLIDAHPNIEEWIRPFIGSEEFINGKERFCLWLKGISPNELRRYPEVLRRMEFVRAARLKSVDENTRRWADKPSLFQADRQPGTRYLLVPKVSSERRRYIPLGFMEPRFITNPTVLVVPEATMYHFGILQAQMHMAWTRYTCGRMKSDYQYSNTIVYNNFPWPTDVTETQRAQIEKLAQSVLDARDLFPDSTLADLYDPLTMPPELTKAHHVLDRAVDRLYHSEPFATDIERVAMLFTRYQLLTALPG